MKENVNYQSELSTYDLLNDRLKLTLAFSKRYQMSTAICYLRMHLPSVLADNKETEIETALSCIIVTRLKRSLRDIDTVIRLNRTDYFLAIADITEADCKIICERIMNSISDTYTIEFNQFNISCNLGVCMYPYGSEDIQELQSFSKTQMYEAEIMGENVFSIYKGKLNETAYRRVMIENDLPYALRKKQMEIVYQPQYHLNEQRVVGIESLIRWNHPILGVIPPNEFIQDADNAGVLKDVFFWLLDEACKNIANDNTYSNIKYSVNLSVNQLLLDGFVKKVSQVLLKHKVSANKITLELTEENEIYKDMFKRVSKTLSDLKEKGFTIALDDFGNGYFSFYNFTNLPIDSIKLDRNLVLSLIKNKHHKNVIAPIIMMAHNLKFQVIIEGIEDIDQLEDWRKMKVDVIQGYFISKPVPFSKLQKAINDAEKRLSYKNIT
ncbi:GGDEF domain-containing phosphodiesterase [Fictibacillus sp. UD]|uniref:putative bifunctional diguanylate cyclase/phosphodiesterase n=1 Tax=Fictibacillus sp. UD TaxID=3038777 RepID=UPI0037453CF5